MAKLKTLARDKGRASWHWQQDGFEHRLRPDEAIEDYGVYIFMNPYRACLLSIAEAWPGWICPEPARFRFTAHLSPAGTPPVEWLEQSDQVAARITTGSL